MTFEGTDWMDLAISLGYKDDYQMFYDLYISHGLSMSQIGVKLGYSLGTIDRRITRLGIPKRKRGGANNMARYRRLLHLMDQRVVYSRRSEDLGKQLGCHPSTVWKYKANKSNYN